MRRSCMHPKMKKPLCWLQNSWVLHLVESLTTRVVKAKAPALKAQWLNLNATSTEFDVRIREICEGKSGIDSKDAGAISNAKTFPQMDNSYELYRFGITMAGVPEVTTPTSTIGDVPVIVPYSKGDEEIVRGAEKLHGIKGKMLTSKGSKEPKDVNKTSAVAAIKKNRYGV